MSEKNLPEGVQRVAAALARWGISVDDSAGQPLGQSAPGALLLLLAELAAKDEAIIQRGELEPIYLREPHITKPRAK